MYHYKAKLVRVIDGDTIELDIDLGFSITIRQTVRLSDINTPELRSKDPVEKINAQRAKSRLSELLNSNPIMIKTEKDSREKFGRILGEIFIGDTSINQQMINEGLAVSYSGGKR